MAAPAVPSAMMKYAPANEIERLSALLEYDVFDKGSEEDFQDLTALAATVCQTPAALVNFIDANSEWSSSGSGVKAEELRRGQFFCSYLLEHPVELLIVEDALSDERFAGMVAGEPHVRFYAGAPLVNAGGQTFGALCVIDFQPRTLDENARNALKLLAKRVVAQLEMRRSLKLADAMTRRYHAALTEAADGIFFYNLDGRVTAANRKFCELTGKTERELGELNVRDIYLPETIAAAPLPLGELGAGLTLTAERRVRRADGTISDVETSSKKIDDDTIQEIVRDVTERRRIQTRLKESERRQREFIEHSPMFFCTHDVDGRITSINPAAYQTLGLTPESVVGKNISAFLSAAERAEFDSYLQEITKSGKAQGTLNVAAADGTRQIWAYDNVMLEHAGEKYVLGYAQDITELKHKQTALIRSRNLFNSFLKHSPVVIAMKDEQFRYVIASELIESVFHTKTNDLLGKTDYDFLPAEVADNVRVKDREILETGQSGIIMQFVPSGDGEDGRYWLSHKFLFTDDEGKKFVGIVAVDITDRKQMESELEAARDAALDSVRLKSAFLTNISHEIRTPMNGVLGMTELLLETPLDRVQREYAETIRESSDALLTVINDILDVAKIEAGKMRFEKVDFDAREVIESTVELISETAFRKNIEIASLIDNSIPRILRGDPGRLRQVLVNLISNAVKFTEKGGIRVEAALVADHASEVELRFSVTDTGIGIDEKNLKSLFHPFMQVDNSLTRQYGGTGLGLVISKEIVKMMNGEISVKSQPQIGSTFSFTAILGKSVSPAKSTDTDSAAAQLHGKRILIAEDNRIIRENLENYCRIWNLLPVQAANGQDALEKLSVAANAHLPFDFAVIDLNLSDWDGFALARRIKTDEKLSSTKIILTTLYGHRGDAAQAKEIGISGYLTKPVRGDQLFDCLAEFVSADRAGDAGTSNLVTRHSLREAKIESNAGIFTPEGNPLRVLVVEDNEINRRVVTEQLKRIGIKADIAEDGVYALEKVAANDYDLVLMDCQMPRMDGYQATREIRRIELERRGAGGKNAPLIIIALTANTLAGEREKCLAAGMNDYLSKPLKINELAAVLQFWQDSDFHQPKIETPETPEFSPTYAGDLSNIIAAPLLQTPADKIFDDDIFELFIEDMTHKLKNLKQAVGDGNAAEIARLAHAVRGNSLAIGVKEIAETAEKLEQVALSSDAAEIFACFEALGDKFDELKSRENLS